jgi:hypothetical protein
MLWFFSSSREFSVLESILAKAAFGTKTVNGPSACKAPTKPAAFNAVTKVEKSSFPTATSTIVPCGSILRKG